MKAKEALKCNICKLNAVSCIGGSGRVALMSSALVPEATVEKKIS